MEPPFVSVIVVCRNERPHIAGCLDSLLRSDYPSERREILVVDGMSTDGTRRIVAEYARRHPEIRLLDNPRRTVPAGMNVGIALARGELILKVDAHSVYPPDYISRCVRYQQEFEADCVGGVVRIAPGAETPMARTIAQVLAHPFGSGNAYVKVGTRKPRWADTAAFGCYRKEVFTRIGPWNEALAGSSDLDLNARLRAAGGRILLVPDIVVRYYADPGLRAFWRHNFADGVWATYVLKFRSRGWSWRHWVPLGFVTGVATLGASSVIWPPARPLLAGVVSCYLLLNVVSSLQIALRARNPLLAPLAILTFSVRHLAHGLGASWGLVLLMLPGVRWQGRRTAGSNGNGGLQC